MRRKTLLLVISLSLCCGASCDMSCSGLPGFSGVTHVELDRATCTMDIVQTVGSTEATATATITHGINYVELAEDQDVLINGQSFVGPSRDGTYTGTLPAADHYTVTVVEPTRGVQTTSVEPPADFDMTSPTDGGTVSLSGFTLTWSGADANLKVTVLLKQTLFGLKRATFGPHDDTGSLLLTAEDLADFQQGANIVITVTKIRERSLINGFNRGQLSAEVSQTIHVSPQP